MLNTLLIALTLSTFPPQATAPATPAGFEIAAQHKRLLGGPHGTLVIDTDGITFRASSTASLRWSYLDLRQIRIVSPTRLILVTYREHQRSGNAHADDAPSYTFDTAGPLPSAVVQFLLAHFPRPMVSAVMPPRSAAASARVAVKQRRDEGELTLYEDGLAYTTGYKQEGRFWRFRDLFSVLRLDPYRLQITAYEGAGSRLHVFTFELKTELPQTMYDAIWQRVNGRNHTPGGIHE